ncbi:Zinc knuckle [Microdochium nivale]|nr:Zinc knuckle [Microdochium nivale]
MVDGVPGYHGAASDPACYNCGIRGHWFNACPEPTRKVPAGLEASLAAKQNLRDGYQGDPQASASRRGKGPVITRYPLPPAPAPSISRYDPPSGVSLPPHPPPSLSYHSPAPYQQSYAPPPYGAPVYHYDPYHQSGPAVPPPPPPPPSHYHHYQHPPHPYLGHPPGPPSYRPPSENPSTYTHDHGRPQSTTSYGYPASHLPNRPPPPSAIYHHSYPPAHEYPRGSPPYLETPTSFHGSPPPHLRQARYSPPLYSHAAYGRDRSPRGQSQDRWRSPQYRPVEEESRYRDRDYGHDRLRYSPREASPHRQRYRHERSPQSRVPVGDDRNRNDRRRDKPQGCGLNRKSEKNHAKQANLKHAEKHAEKAKPEKPPRQKQQSANDPKQATPAEKNVQWGLVVPYMPVWDFEDDKESDQGTATKPEGSLEDDEDLEWTLGQLFAEWVPYFQACAISRPLPREYSEDPIQPPMGYEAALQTEFITATNVDQFAMSVRETKEWRSKKLLPLWTNPMEIHPRILTKLPRPKAGPRNGSQPVSKKANGPDRSSNFHQDNKTTVAQAFGGPQLQQTAVSDQDLKNGRDSDKQVSPIAISRQPPSPLNLLPRQDDKGGSYDTAHAKTSGHTQSSIGVRPISHESNGSHLQPRDTNQGQSERNRMDTDISPCEADESATTHSLASNASKRKLSLNLDDGRPMCTSIELDMSHDSAWVPQTIDSKTAHTETKHLERPSSRGSLRSWHSHHGLSRQASIVSELSRPESPLTPTEMALLGIEGFDDSDSENDNEGGAKISLTPSPPPPPPSRQRQVHVGGESSSTKSRPMKRQAAALPAEEATPRTKKRRQQVASAFSRRW